MAESVKKYKKHQAGTRSRRLFSITNDFFHLCSERGVRRKSENERGGEAVDQMEKCVYPVGGEDSVIHRKIEDASVREDFWKALFKK